MFNRYRTDPLAGGPARRAPLPEVAAERELVVEDAETGFCGAVMSVEKQPEGFVVVLEDRNRKRRSFPLGAGFLLEGRPVRLVRPAAAGPKQAARTASGSLAVRGQRARVALEGRIYVEGRHDAELIERVWGDDLRVEGVVVEYLAGVDDLPTVVREFGPGPGRRLGVLVDHLVPGSKEQRLAQRVFDEIGSPHVHVVGHPYIDIWQAVRPAAVGITAWPVVPKGVPWKEGVCRALGWPADTAAAWRRILASVDSYADLEPELLGRVEELIDFVTVGSSGDER